MKHKINETALIFIGIWAMLPIVGYINYGLEGIVAGLFVGASVFIPMLWIVHITIGIFNNETKGDRK